LAIVESLDANTIRRQMGELDERRRALSALLRVACVRERAARRRQATVPPEGGPDAAQ
jgi:hypothetical protein